MSIPSVIDITGVAVITGGASGFGFDIAERLARNGMAVALLDVSRDELRKAEEMLHAIVRDKRMVLPIVCNVTVFEECQIAQRKVAETFPTSRISLLFNNAGIQGQGYSGIIDGDMTDWKSTFAVNVFGAVHIIKAFLPIMIEGGPLPSGKKSFVVTTSSVVGLLNHNIGPYSTSKMAATAVCEQMAIELDMMGTKAAHISPHSLHPTVGATKFLTGRNEDGKAIRGEEVLKSLAQAGMTTATQVIDALFNGLADGKHYIIHDHELDIPTPTQIEMRMQDQMKGRRPRKPEQLGMVLMLSGNMKEFKLRQEQLKQKEAKSRL